QQGQISRDGRPDQVMSGLMARAGGAPITTPATPSAAAAPQQSSALQLRQVRVQTPAPTTSTPAATPDAMAAQTQE
ncbi:MAG: hypothetical protein RR718_08210, partial [Comamonas sp.]